LSFYTLGLKPIIIEPISGEVIRQTLKEVLDPYKIEEKNIGSVTDSWFFKVSFSKITLYLLFIQ